MCSWTQIGKKSEWLRNLGLEFHKTHWNPVIITVRIEKYAVKFNHEKWGTAIGEEIIGPSWRWLVWVSNRMESRLNFFHRLFFSPQIILPASERGLAFFFSFFRFVKFSVEYFFSSSDGAILLDWGGGLSPDRPSICEREREREKAPQFVRHEASVSLFASFFSWSIATRLRCNDLFDGHGAPAQWTPPLSFRCGDLNARPALHPLKISFVCFPFVFGAPLAALVRSLK